MAMEEDESNATLLDHLADVYAKMDNKKKAIEYWRKALELDPTIKKVNEKLEKIGKG